MLIRKWQYLKITATSILAGGEKGLLIQSITKMFIIQRYTSP
jgi:hypothetical protein